MLVGGVLDRLEDAHPGVVHQDVDHALALIDRRYDVGDHCRVGDVETGHGDPLDRVAGRLEQVTGSARIAHRGVDRVTPPCERHGRSQTDPAAAPGDHDDGHDVIIAPGVAGGRGCGQNRPPRTVAP